MATWILVGGFVALGLILTGAVLLVFVFTRERAEPGIRLPGLNRFGDHDSDDVPPAPKEL